MHPASKALSEIDDILCSDVSEARQLLNSDPTSNFARRILVKTLFTYLEGLIFAFKQEILALEDILCTHNRFVSKDSKSRWQIRILSDAEKCMLRGVTYDLSGNKAREANYYPKLGDNIKFTFASYQKAFQLPDKIDYNSSGWSKLMEAQVLRNRLTHPKGIESLQIDPEDIASLEAAIAWFDSTIDSLHDRAQKESIYGAGRDLFQEAQQDAAANP